MRAAQLATHRFRAAVMMTLATVWLFGCGTALGQTVQEVMSKRKDTIDLDQVERSYVDSFRFSNKAGMLLAGQSGKTDLAARARILDAYKLTPDQVEEIWYRTQESVPDAIVASFFETLKHDYEIPTGWTVEGLLSSEKCWPDSYSVEYHKARVTNKVSQDLFGRTLLAYTGMKLASVGTLPKKEAAFGLVMEHFGSHLTKSCQRPDVVTSFKALLDDYGLALDGYVATRDTEAARKLATEQERTAERLQAEREREEGLRKGRIAISNFADAMIFYGALESGAPILSPLLEPDRKVYGFQCELDKELSEGVLLGKCSDRPTRYVEIRLTKDTDSVKREDWRFHRRLRVIGRYVANNRYLTVLGEEETMAVVEALYITPSLE